MFQTTNCVDVAGCKFGWQCLCFDGAAIRARPCTMASHPTRGLNPIYFVKEVKKRLKVGGRDERQADNLILRQSTGSRPQALHFLPVFSTARPIALGNSGFLLTRRSEWKVHDSSLFEAEPLTVTVSKISKTVRRQRLN